MSPRYQLITSLKFAYYNFFHLPYFPAYKTPTFLQVLGCQIEGGVLYASSQNTTDMYWLFKIFGSPKVKGVLSVGDSYTPENTVGITGSVC